MMSVTFPLIAVMLSLLFTLPMLFGSSCNEAVCASIVSKCMLTQSCKCDAKNTSCSKDCFYCLDYLYTECCSCVEMCPKSNETDSFLSQKSHVEDLAEPFPDLFAVLTEDEDRLLRWTSYVIPNQVSFITADKEVKFVVAKPGTETTDESLVLNCTVAFMSQCMSWNKCKNSCSSMGASSYRWFHDGCCECVGSTCINYGINESRCRECPPDREIVLEEEERQPQQQIDDEKPKEKEEKAPTKLPEEEDEAEEEEEDEDNALVSKDDKEVEVAAAEKMQNIDA